MEVIEQKTPLADAWGATVAAQLRTVKNYLKRKTVDKEKLVNDLKKLGEKLGEFAIELDAIVISYPDEQTKLDFECIEDTSK